MIRAILFDLDGTLVDTLTDISAAMNRSLRLHGLPEFPREEYRYLVGNGAKVLSRRVTKACPALAESVRREYQRWYEAHDLEASRPYDGMPEALRRLRAAGLSLCVLSNKPDADTRRVVEHYFPDAGFALIRGQRPGVPVKPDPAAALAMAEEMGIAPGDFLYLGDTAVDMECAAAAGMKPAGALWGFRTEAELRAAGAAFLLRRPEELPEIAGTPALPGNRG